MPSPHPTHFSEDARTPALTSQAGGMPRDYDADRGRARVRLADCLKPDGARHVNFTSSERSGQRATDASVLRLKKSRLVRPGCGAAELRSASQMLIMQSAPSAQPTQARRPYARRGGVSAPAPVHCGLEPAPRSVASLLSLTSLRLTPARRQLKPDAIVSAFAAMVALCSAISSRCPTIS